MKNLGTIKKVVAETVPAKLSGRFKYPIRKKHTYKGMEDLPIITHEVVDEEGNAVEFPLKLPVPIVAPAPVEAAPAQTGFTFNITVPVAINNPLAPPNVIVNNEVLPTPITVGSPQVTVNPQVITVESANVVVNNAVPIPEVVVNNEIKLQPYNDSTNFSVVRDDSGNITGIKEEY